jgi:hypothetical protein
LTLILDYHKLVDQFMVIQINNQKQTNMKTNYYKPLGWLKSISLTALLAIATMSCQEEQDISMSTNLDHQTLSSSSVKLAVSSVSASTTDGSNVAANTLDGSTSTRWSGYGNGAYITYDLGSSVSIDYIKLAVHKGDTRKASYEVWTGTSTGSLTKIKTKTSGGSTTGKETIDLPNTTARYLRIVGKGYVANGSTTVNLWNSFTITEIWGTGSTSGGGTGGGGTGGGTAVYPSDLMTNYNQWKITYPDGVEDKTLFQATNEYFFVNSAKDGIVFKAPIRSSNGTTPNSSYVRSELRERTADGSADIFWTTSGTHVVYSKQAITHLPIVKDHLVATQIHGDKSSGIDDAMVLRLEGSHLFLSFNGGSLRSNLTIKTNYTLGTKHEVIFEVINGKHYCYYSEDGNLGSAYLAGNASSYLVKDGSNSYVMNKSYSDAYFKIGNYTQSNADKEGSETGKANNYGEVVVYDFWVKH